jgi:uncharacterized protein involved in response to NO
MRVLFSYAFRPLFLLATLYAILIVPFWVTAWLGVHPMPALIANPIAWHAHEMVYGFAGAAVGGFALTAVATWTKRPPVAGAPLVLLSVLWLLARILFLLPFEGLLVAAAAADLGYCALLLLLMVGEVIGARNERNYKVLGLLALLLATDVLFFVGAMRNPAWMMTSALGGLWTVVLLVNLVGGRIIPAFTGNWLRRQREATLQKPQSLPPSFNRFDLLTTWLLVTFAVLHVLGGASPWTAAIGCVTGLLLLLRLLRWQGQRTLKEPLVWVLHLAFVWIPVGVLLLSAAELGLVPRTAGTHALAGGGIATMIVAVAGRAALGHTGRPLASHPLVTVSYLLITCAAVLRVAAASGSAARILLMLSATLWTVGFLCFAWRYTPILIRSALPQTR